MPPNRGTSQTAGAERSRLDGVIHSRRPYPDVDTVLREMARLARQYRSRPRVRNVVQTVTRGVDLSDADAVAHAVWTWIRENVRYVRDPEDTELLQSPDLILKKPRYADCDGMSVLAAAMLSSVNIDSGFRAVALQETGAYDHVYAVYDPGSGDEWHALDATVGVPPGPDRHVQSAKSVKTVPLNSKTNSSEMASPQGSNLNVAGSRRRSSTELADTTSGAPGGGADLTTTSNGGGGGGGSNRPIWTTLIDEVSEVTDSIFARRRSGGGGGGGGGGTQPPQRAPRVDTGGGDKILGMEPTTLAVVGVGGTLAVWMVSEMVNEDQ